MFKVAYYNDNECGIVGYEGKEEIITIPSTSNGKRVVEIGHYAFEGCSSLVSVTIPDGIEAIGNSAFYDCSSLKSIIIPKSVSSVGTCTFLDCNENLVIKCEAEEKPEEWADDWNPNNRKVIWGYVDENKKKNTAKNIQKTRYRWRLFTNHRS